LPAASPPIQEIFEPTPSRESVCSVAVILIEIGVRHLGKLKAAAAAAPAAATVSEWTEIRAYLPGSELRKHTSRTPGRLLWKK